MTSFASWPDLDLLTLHSRWIPDLGSPAADHERLMGVRLVASAVPLQWRLLPGSALPDAVLDRIAAVLEDEPPGSSPSPALIEPIRSTAQDDVLPRIDGGPVHLFAGPIKRTVPSDVTIVTAADRDASDLLAARPLSWEDGEWRELVTGKLGPWSAVVAHRQVVSLTHTARLLPGAAECGVWTDPAFRGRRLAGVATSAWAELAAASGRALFYSTDHRNTASQRVAHGLGLRHIGWQWTISTEQWAEGDAWGQALGDHLCGRWTPTPDLETDFGEAGDAMNPGWFFRPFDDWVWWERELVPLAARSPALDLGAGAGRTSLWLQEQGIEVTAVDSSPGAVEVCRARGVADVRLGDLNQPPEDKRWRAIFLLCGGLGLGGSWDGTRRLLRRLAEVAERDAVLVGDTVEPSGTPDLGLRIRYKGKATTWWRQRNIPIVEIPALVEGTGWIVDRHLVDLPDHAVLLRRR